MMKKIYKSLPVGYKEVKKVQLNYSLVEDDQIGTRIKNWSVQKIMSILGSNEGVENLGDWFISNLMKKIELKELIKQTQSFLEDFAEEFCVDLWRAVMFEEKKKSDFW